MLLRPIFAIRPAIQPAIKAAVHSAFVRRGVSQPVVALERFFAGGVAGKTATFWGDSTTQLALVMFEILQTEITSPGGELAGLNVVNLGSTGQTLAGAINDLPGVYASNPDLIVLCYGINDVRQGGTNAAALQALLITAVDLIRTNLPDCDIVIWTPNSLLSSDPGDTGYVVPLSAAQQYTDAMWTAYQGVAGMWDHTVYLDKQQVFGRVCQPTSPLMNDILHPGNDGQRAALEQLLPHITPPPVPIDLAASAAAWASNPAAPWTVYSRALEDTRYATLVRSIAITTYLDLGGTLLLYLSPRHGDDAPFTPEHAAQADFFWTPNGVYAFTGDESFGVIGDDVQIYAGIAIAAFPPNDPPLHNSRLYRRV